MSPNEQLVLNILQYVFSPYAFAFYGLAFHYFVSYLPAQQQTRVKEFMRRAVVVVEQTQPLLTNPEKFAEAQRIFGVLCNEAGVKPPSQTFQQAILEEMVYAIKNADGSTPTSIMPKIK